MIVPRISSLNKRGTGLLTGFSVAEQWRKMRVTYAMNKCVIYASPVFAVYRIGVLFTIDFCH